MDELWLTPVFVTNCFFTYLDKARICDDLFGVDDIYQGFCDGNLPYSTHIKPVNIIPPYRRRKERKKTKTMISSVLICTEKTKSDPFKREEFHLYKNYTYNEEGLSVISNIIFSPLCDWSLNSEAHRTREKPYL